MTTLTTQMDDLLRQSEQVLAGLGLMSPIAKPKLKAAIAEVRRSYADDRIVPGPIGHQSCIAWAKDGLGTSSINFNWTCNQWAANLKQALVRLAEALTNAGEPGWAEVAWSMADQTGTLSEQSYATVAESFDPIAAALATPDPDAAQDAKDAGDADRKARKTREMVMRNLWWAVPVAAAGAATWYFWPILIPMLRLRSGASKLLESGQPNQMPVVTDFAGLSEMPGTGFVGFSEIKSGSTWSGLSYTAGEATLLLGGGSFGKLGTDFVDASWEPIDDG